MSRDSAQSMSPTTPSAEGPVLLESSAPSEQKPARVESLARLRCLIVNHHDLVWRTLRRLGVRDRDIEDAMQQVFIVVGNKLNALEPSRERSFIFGVAIRVASDCRRSVRRHPEDLVTQFIESTDPRPDPEAKLHRVEQLELLGELLKRLPEEQRAVLMLHEFEEMTVVEIAAMLELPLGTVGSRLRRARLAFGKLVSERRKFYELEET